MHDFSVALSGSLRAFHVWHSDRIPFPLSLVEKIQHGPRQVYSVNDGLRSFSRSLLSRDIMAILWTIESGVLQGCTQSLSIWV